MKVASIYGAFNARWLEPEDVARSFVPTTHFKSLVRFQNSLLMGPRGCGKTTLLKMLTRRAQKIWVEEMLPLEPNQTDYRRPDFEAIYIASDVRWSSELESLSATLATDPKCAELMQRALVSISSIIEATRTFQDLIEASDLDPFEFLKSIINHFGLGPTVPSFQEIRLKLRTWTEDLQSALVRNDIEGLNRRLASLPSAMTGHALGGITRACSIFDEYMPLASPTRWALCFDEIEIAPQWLQIELFEALRSFEQKFLLKITWSPVLPTNLMPTQERQHDFATIRMWHGHVIEARPFCKEFTLRYIRDKFESSVITPKEVFGTSLFSQEEGDPDTYKRGGIAWNAMVKLADRDVSFRDYLEAHGISPKNPTVSDISIRDESLRKAKPIVLLREAYFGDDATRHVRRSRKNTALYFGEDVIYSMSEGNPRLLAGLLNDLLDAEGKQSASNIAIKPELQSRILASASQRTLSGIKAYPIRSVSSGRSLARLVELIAKYLKDELVTRDFNADPVGSFFVDEDVPLDVIDEISVGLLIGAFVHVKSLNSDIPSSIVGCRFRLSYMLSPFFGLLFRNNRELRLSTALRVTAASQRLIFRS